MFRGSLRLIAVGLLLGTPLSALAEDLVLPEDGSVEAELADGVTLRGGIGLLALEANEFVYDAAGSDTRLSQLIWQSTSPVLTAGLDVSLPEGWTFSASAQIAMGGNGYMEDYDWIAPYATGTGDDDWSHRSQHDDTALESYFNGSIIVGHDLPMENDGVRLNINGGFKYTDVKWAASGGSFVYSVGGFRNLAGDLVDEPVITYRQVFPALIMGVNGEVTDGGWTFSGGAHAGVTFNAKDIDHHWMTIPARLFEDSLQMAPLLSAEASVGYQVREGMQLFLAGSVEKMFTARGDTTISNISNGNLLGSLSDQAGADLFAATISFGVKATF
jgi:plasminogen activator